MKDWALHKLKMNQENEGIDLYSASHYSHYYIYRYSKAASIAWLVYFEIQVAFLLSVQDKQWFFLGV